MSKRFRRQNATESGSPTLPRRNLAKMSHEEFAEAFLAARQERKVKAFLTLWTAWKIRKEQHDDIGKFIRDLRTLLNSPELDDDRTQRVGYLGHIIESTVERFTRLIDAGVIA
jgi:hypothetical protein